MSLPVCVLDASVGVKWFRDEPGSEESRGLVEEHIAGTLTIVVDTLFCYEVLRAASRDTEPRDATRIWSDLARLDLITVPLGEELVAAATDARADLGCSLYDAFSAGVASLLGAPLYSADARAHGAHPGVRLIGRTRSLTKPGQRPDGSRTSTLG
ncbi:MAG: type II toxin-antitoxin system VapC family toxin [Coriobacteriia bacterium]|nr:type II toxin-antitoxin system VapC family toxin [Coriobacteriia bacterium]